MKDIYVIHKPVKLNDIYIIPTDNSIWDTKRPYIKTKNGSIPNRESKIKFENLLIPRNNYFSKINNYGIYLLYFKNQKRDYVGIATMHSKYPETISKRIKKHRAKATATMPFDGPFINHTNYKKNGWRSLAKLRHQECLNKNSFDSLDDCYLTVINILQHEKFIDFEKNKLEHLEYLISNRFTNTTEKILKSINYIGSLNDWEKLGRSTKGREHHFKLVYWDDEEYNVRIYE